MEKREMKFVPLLHVRNVREAVDFYTRVLGFDIHEGDKVDALDTAWDKASRKVTLSIKAM